MEILFTKKARKTTPYKMSFKKIDQKEDNNLLKLDKIMVITELKKGRNNNLRKFYPTLKTLSINDNINNNKKSFHPFLSFKLKKLNLSTNFQSPKNIKNDEFLLCKKINLLPDDNPSKKTNYKQLPKDEENILKIIRNKTIGNFKIVSKLSDDLQQNTIYINQNKSSLKKILHTKRTFDRQPLQMINEKNLKINIAYNRNQIKYFQYSHTEIKKKLDFLTQKIIGQNRVTNLLDCQKITKMVPEIKVAFSKRKSIDNYLPKFQKFYFNQKSIPRLEKVNDDINKMKQIFPFEFLKPQN